MRSIFNTLNTRHVDNLFIQPTMWCAFNCIDCYVKASSVSSLAIPLKFWQALMHSYIFQKNECYANQITISIDSLPKNNSLQKDYMKNVFDTYSALAVQAQSFLEKPELHITIHDINVLNQDYKALDLLSIKRVFDLISFSWITMEDIPMIQEIRKTKTLVNWNCMPNGISAERLANKLTELAPHLDQIYLILNKDPIGKSGSMEIGKHKMKYYTDIAGFLMKNLATDVKAKIQIDGCVQIASKYQTSNLGCSSNISRVQVWPDGTVSGCPYAGSTIGKRPELFEDLLENISRSRKQYDFKKCHLPQNYKDNQKRSTNSSLKILE